MRIGVDAMGGDNAPEAEVKGALKARPLLKEGDKIVLVGDEKAIRAHLGDDDWSDFIDIRHADDVIGMDDSPVVALRAKPNSSIAVLVQMHADGEVDACVSAGNTGAFVAAAQMRLRRLKGVHRPGIAIMTPTLHGPVAVCDVGANVNCRPHHLQQYGVMSSIYLKAIVGIENPRVGLLSIGEEDAKGNDLVKETRELMKNDPAQNFIGNVEARALFSNACDVLVCEGFVGNVVLKLIEGMGKGVLKAMVQELATALPASADYVKMVGLGLMKKYDYNEYGGAPLLGVGGTCIICHGASNSDGLMNAVRVARDLVVCHVNEQIVQALSQEERAVHA